MSSKRVFLVAVDSSAESTLAVEKALNLATEHDEVFLLAVANSGFSEDEATKYTNDVKPGRFRGRLDRRVEKGDPRLVICQQAKAFAADYVVIGSRGRGAIASLLGSVSDYVVRHAPCAVIVVRDPLK